MTTIRLEREQIAKLLETNNIGDFIGVIETSYFEFREKPYFPDNPNDTVSKEKSRLELIKDFSSIANSGGGYILIGLIPGEEDSQFNLEYVKEIKGVEAEKINLKGWLDILSAYLVPKFEENFIKHGVIGTDKKLFWIQIPDAKSIGCYPFVLSKDQWITENDKLLKGELYGIYFRDGSKNRQLLSAEKFQERMSQISKNMDLSENTSISTIEDKIDRLLALQESPTTTKTVDIESEEKETINNFEKKLDKDSDIFYMIAIPTEKLEINSFWDTGENSLHSLIKNPPTLRKMGWDLNVYLTESPKPDNDTWEIMNGNRKILVVKKSGIVGASATIQEFLDWGTNRDGEVYKPIINAFALVEYIDMYCHFLKEYTAHFIRTGIKYKIIVGFRLNTNQKFKLHFTVGNFPSLAPNTLAKLRWSFDDIDSSEFLVPQMFAAKILIEVYASGFGYTGNHLQYLKKDNDIWSVDEELYIKQK